MKTDVVVIGGGIVGCAAAYYLGKKGFQVLVVEKGPSVGLQASGRNGGGVRQHGRKAALPLAMESVKLWATLEKELQADLEYSRTGNLKIAFEEASAQDFEREFVWERENGLNEVRMLSAAECDAMVPGRTAKPCRVSFAPPMGLPTRCLSRLPLPGRAESWESNSS